MNAIDPHRRALLRGGRSALPRPPWAVPDFESRCTRCGDCLDVCETGVLVRADGGFPGVDFSREGCTFCAACARACAAAAFGDPSDAPWRLRVVPAGGCLSESGVACRACEDVCEPGAIAFRPLPGGRARLLVEPARCTGCGACVAPCPAGVLHMEEAA